MAYLCVAITMEVVKKAIFQSKEEALDFFRENYEENIRTWMEEERKRIKAKIRDSEQRIEKENENEHQSKEDIKEKLDKLYKKKENSQMELEEVDQWLQGEGNMKVSYWDEKFSQYRRQIITEEPELFLHMAGVFKEGSNYKVVEEKYFSTGCLINKGKGAMDVVKCLPERFMKDSISLHICKDSEKFREKMVNKISKVRTKICQSHRKEQRLYKDF